MSYETRASLASLKKIKHLAERETVFMNWSVGIRTKREIVLRLNRELMWKTISRSFIILHSIQQFSLFNAKQKLSWKRRGKKLTSFGMEKGFQPSAANQQRENRGKNENISSVNIHVWNLFTFSRKYFTIFCAGFLLTCTMTCTNGVEAFLPGRFDFQNEHGFVWNLCRKFREFRAYCCLTWSKKRRLSQKIFFLLIQQTEQVNRDLSLSTRNHQSKTSLIKHWAYHRSSCGNRQGSNGFSLPGENCFSLGLLHAEASNNKSKTWIITFHSLWIQTIALIISKVLSAGRSNPEWSLTNFSNFLSLLWWSKLLRFPLLSSSAFFISSYSSFMLDRKKRASTKNAKTNESVAQP